jgi:hypothetical protein
MLTWLQKQNQIFSAEHCSNNNHNKIFIAASDLQLLHLD